MRDNKINQNTNGSIQKGEKSPTPNCANSVNLSNHGKVVSIERIIDQNKLALINQIVRTTRSF
jgi:hypothetical protein